MNPAVACFSAGQAWVSLSTITATPCASAISAARIARRAKRGLGDHQSRVARIEVRHRGAQRRAAAPGDLPAGGEIAPHVGHVVDQPGRPAGAEQHHPARPVQRLDRRLQPLGVDGPAHAVDIGDARRRLPRQKRPARAVPGLVAQPLRALREALVALAHRIAAEFAHGLVIVEPQRPRQPRECRRRQPRRRRDRAQRPRRHVHRVVGHEIGRRPQPVAEVVISFGDPVVDRRRLLHRRSGSG